VLRGKWNPQEGFGSKAVSADDEKQIKVGVIETRLALLDQAGDNDFFKVPYGAYRKEEWGWGI
jgi:hypothetical protein